MGERYPITEPVIKEALAEKLREGLPDYPKKMIKFPDAVKVFDLAQAQYSDSLNVFFLAEYLFRKVYKYDVSTGSFLWESQTLAGPRVYGIDYNRSVNRVVVANESHIYELDASDGSIKRDITSTSLGPLGSVRSVRYHREKPNYVFFTDYDKHVFGRLNMDTGNVDYVFGTYGTAKYDNTGLNRPLGFDVPTSPTDGSIYSNIVIADEGNNRVLFINPSNMSVTYIMPMSGAGFVEMWGDHVDKAYFDYSFMLVAPSPYAWKTGDYSMLIEYQRIEFIAPFFLDWPAFSPYDKGKILGCRRYAAEWDMSIFSHKVSSLSSYMSYVAEGVSISAGATYPTNPWETVITNLHRQRAVLIHSTQSATGYIDVPKGMYFPNSDKYLSPTFTWKEYDSFPVSAGKWTPYIFTNPPPVFRVRVVMGSASGVISIYTYGRD
jgi:hypothetical protein